MTDPFEIRGKRRDLSIAEKHSTQLRSNDISESCKEAAPAISKRPWHCHTHDFISNKGKRASEGSPDGLLVLEGVSIHLVRFVVNVASKICSH